MRREWPTRWRTCVIFSLFLGLSKSAPARVVPCSSGVVVVAGYKRAARDIMFSGTPPEHIASMEGSATTAVLLTPASNSCNRDLILTPLLCPPPTSNAMFSFQRGMKFLSTSAKTGDNVEEAFVTLARSILQAGQGKPSLDGAKSHRLHVSKPVQYDVCIISVL